MRSCLELLMASSGRRETGRVLTCICKGYEETIRLLLHFTVGCESGAFKVCLYACLKTILAHASPVRTKQCCYILQNSIGLSFKFASASTFRSPSTLPYQSIDYRLCTSCDDLQNRNESEWHSPSSGSFCLSLACSAYPPSKAMTIFPPASVCISCVVKYP